MIAVGEYVRMNFEPLVDFLPKQLASILALRTTWLATEAGRIIAVTAKAD